MTPGVDAAVAHTRRWRSWSTSFSLCNLFAANKLIHNHARHMVVTSKTVNHRCTPAALPHHNLLRCEINFHAKACTPTDSSTRMRSRMRLTVAFQIPAPRANSLKCKNRARHQSGTNQAGTNQAPISNGKSKVRRLVFGSGIIFIGRNLSSSG